MLSDGNVTTHPLQQMKYIVDELGTQGVGDLSTVKTNVPLSGLCSKNRKYVTPQRRCKINQGYLHFQLRNNVYLFSLIDKNSSNIFIRSYLMNGK